MAEEEYASHFAFPRRVQSATVRDAPKRPGSLPWPLVVERKKTARFPELSFPLGRAVGNILVTYIMYILDLPPQDASGKWRFWLGFPTKNVI